MVHSGTSAATFISTTAMLSAVELGNQPKTVDVRHWLNMFTLVRHIAMQFVSGLNLALIVRSDIIQAY